MLASIGMGKVMGAEQFRSSKRKVNIIHNQGHTRQIPGAVVAFVLQRVKPSGIVGTGDGSANAARGVRLFPGWAGFVDASEMLHGIDDNSGNPVVILLNEVETRLIALGEEHVARAMKKGDARNVTMVRRSESHNHLLGTGRSNNVFESGINRLAATERIADLESTKKRQQYRSQKLVHIMWYLLTESFHVQRAMIIKHIQSVLT